MIKGDPYLIPGTGDTTKLLRNKLGITEQSELSEQENLLAGTRINELRKDLSILGNDKPDQKLLEKIHEYIFQDVYHTQGEHPYPIAGAVRVIGIRKLGDPQYPEPHSKYADNDLDNRIDYAFNQLEKDGYLKGLDQTYSSKNSLSMSLKYGRITAFVKATREVQRCSLNTWLVKQAMNYKPLAVTFEKR